MILGLQLVYLEKRGIFSIDKLRCSTIFSNCILPFFFIIRETYFYFKFQVVHVYNKVLFHFYKGFILSWHIMEIMNVIVHHSRKSFKLCWVKSFHKFSLSFSSISVFIKHHLFFNATMFSLPLGHLFLYVLYCSLCK